MNALQRFMVMAVCLLAFAGQAQAFERQKFPKGSPQEAVEALLYGDFMTDYRDDPAHYGYGSYLFIPKVADNPDLTLERTDWEYPCIRTYIDWYRVLDVEYPAPSSEIGQAGERAVVRVAVKVRGLHILHTDSPYPVGAYAWPDLVITGDATGAREKAQLEFSDQETFYAAVKKLGTIVGDNPPSIRIPDNRRNWEFRVYMVFDEKDKRWRAVKPYFPTVSSLQRAIDTHSHLYEQNNKTISKRCLGDKLTQQEQETCSWLKGHGKFLQSIIVSLKAIQ